MIHKGLTTEQVEESRKKHGSNILTPPEKESLWHQFIEKFKDPIIRILLIALGLSIAVSLYQYFTTEEGLSVLFEPIGIFVAIAIAIVIFILMNKTTLGYELKACGNNKNAAKDKYDDYKEIKLGDYDGYAYSYSKNTYRVFGRFEGVDEASMQNCYMRIDVRPADGNMDTDASALYEGEYVQSIVKTLTYNGIVTPESETAE